MQREHESVQRSNKDKFESLTALQQEREVLTSENKALKDKLTQYKSVAESANDTSTELKKANLTVNTLQTMLKTLQQEKEALQQELTSVKNSKAGVASAHKREIEKLKKQYDLVD